MSTFGPIEAGGRFGDLEIEAEIGAGAFGVVYRARDAVIGRLVALKVVRSLGAGALPAEERKRFLREARALGALAHPNVATLYHVHALEHGGWMLEMEYVEGTTLDAVLDGGRRLPVAEAVALARDVGAGLRAAHAAHVVHGDVKPANVLRRKDGLVKLVDFGLARVLGTESGRPSASKLSGTPHYMAPEVINGEGHVPASDVWGLGALLYRALAGRLPFDAPGIVPLFYAILETAAPPLPEDVPAAVRRLVMACLAKRPEDRPALDDRFFDALDLARRVVVAPVEPTRPAAPPATPLVGREAECARLAAAIERVAGGRTDLLAITGPAGIGKSRLTGFADATARARGFVVVTSTTSAVEGVIRPLHRALVVETGGSTGSASEGTGSGSRGGRGRAAGPVEVERRLAALAAAHPVLVIVEDLHRAAAEDVRALGRLAARLEGSPVLFVVTERVPDLDASTDAAPKVEPLIVEGRERLEVDGLSRDALHAILERSAGEARLGANVLERAVKRSGGNPLFALEILAHERQLAAAAAAAPPGAAGAEGERLSRGGSSSSIVAPPPALRDVLARRLRGLPVALREVLDVAAVDGLEFDAEALAQVLGVPALDVLRRLQRLARTHGLVVAKERGHRFAHPLMQEVVYAEVSPEMRRALHRGLAEHLETRAETIDPERLGTHWERAEEPAKAMPWLLEAAHRAAMRLENWRCVDLATRAGIVPGKTPAALVLAYTNHVFEIASAASDLGRQADRDALYEDVARAASAGHDELLLLRVGSRRALSRLLTTGLDAPDDLALRTAIERLPDGVDRGLACYAAGVGARHRGDVESAERHLRQAAAIYRSHGERGRLGSTLDQLASLAMDRCAIHEAEAGYAEAAGECRESGRFANAEISEVNAALARVESGSTAGIAGRLARAVRVLEADGLRSAAARVRVALARVLIASDDPRRAEVEARRALADATESSLWMARFEALECLADLAALRGERKEAAALEASIEALLIAKGQDHRLDGLSAGKALRAALAGECEAAHALGRRAIEHASSRGGVLQRATTGAVVAAAAAICADAELADYVVRFCRSEFAPQARELVSWQLALVFGRGCLAEAKGEARALEGCVAELSGQAGGIQEHLRSRFARGWRALSALTITKAPTSTGCRGSEAFDLTAAYPPLESWIRVRERSGSTG